MNLTIKSGLSSRYEIRLVIIHYRFVIDFAQFYVTGRKLSLGFILVGTSWQDVPKVLSESVSSVRF